MTRTCRLAAASALALFAASAAAAQTAPATPSDQTPGTTVGELVVTGSRLPTTILNSPNPIVAVTSTQLEQTGTLDNLERALVQQPAIDAGFTDTDSENFYAAAGLNLIDLRHLGYNRTLVLVNGRRQVPGDLGTGAVDINSIPTEMVERVDIVTGGLSAVYGADAVSGVVNIILKNHYQGFDARVSGGITRYMDGEQWGVGFIAGHNFDHDRLNVTAAFDWDRSEGVPALARPWGRDVISVIPNDNAGPNGPAYLTVHNALFFGIDQKGFIAVSPYGPNDFYTPNATGTAFLPYNYGDLSHQTVNDVLNNGVQIGGDGGYYRPFDNLSLPLQRFAASLDVTYDLTPKIEAFLEGRWSESWVKDRWQPTADFENGEIFINANNPYIPASFQPIIAASGQGGFYFGREYVDEGRRGADDDRFMNQYTAGLRGDVGRFKWEAFAGWGETNLFANLVGARDQAKFLQSTDVILLNGQPACADPAARAAGCQPFNPFYPASTPAGGAYSRVASTFSGRNDLATAGADISGDLFNLWAGPVSASLGVEARRDSQSNSAGVCGIQMLCSAPYSGHVNVGEVFGETRVPLLKDLPLIHEAYFQGAVRYSDYSTNHGHFSWNLGGVVSPIDGLNFRIMRSRSVRAPNVDELYATESQAFQNLDDPCSVLNIPLNPNRAKNCAALGIPAGFAQTTSSKATYSGGNPDLNVETADTWVGGVTIGPRLVPNLTLSADYFSINLDGAIGAIDPQTLLDTCVDLPVAPSSNPACAAITRDPTTHQISAVFSNNQNLGRVYTAGYDFDITYEPPLNDFWATFPGALTLNAQATYLIRLRQFDNLADPTTQHQYEGYLGVPKWKVVGSATYDLAKWAFTWRVTYYSSTSIFGSNLLASPTPGNIFDLQTTGSKLYNDLSVAYRINPATNLRFNVDNIFNVEPPQRSGINDGITYGGTPWATAGLYPNLGTTFSLVLDHKFR